MSQKFTIGAVFAAAFLALSSFGASAGTVLLQGSATGPDMLRGTLTCAPSCEGLLTSGAYSMTRADVFTAHPSKASELAFVNGKTGSMFEDLVKDEDPGNSFTSAAAYILLKIGGGNTFNVALIKNTSGGLLSFTYEGGKRSGLSHVSEFGMATPPAPVPLPAAGGLMAAGMIALGLLRRRRAS
ncbi:VPLPA-CTERM sorting domain-containing protein [Falsirhodobacter xinxiangensis]|uniref:VPLPA-CTERM sorting domain-containing protein n=1 Tax=Falsirhodobacter xinxiangensis TaxID=2530049 RepID=UPI0010AA5BA4|nr:VPLPA-CTERM sorting domain-containing protein [Rhodobacter xinxiangensis]